MENKIKELKKDIAEAEAQLKDPDINSDAEIVDLLNDAIQQLHKEIAELEAQSTKEVFIAEKKVMQAEKKVNQAETKTEKVEAKEQLKEAKEVKKEAEKDVKEVEKIAEKVDKVADKVEAISAKGGVRTGAGRPKVIGRMEKPKATWGGGNRGAGRKKASTAKTMTVPKGVKTEKLVVSKRKLKAKVKAKPEVQAVAKTKIKTARAFGQVIEYKNDAEFCSKLKAAFRKRRAAAKLGGKTRKTKPVFGVITTSVKNAVSKALHSVSTKEIEKNPKQFLVKSERLEKSAIRFLEDFKAILGSDFKKSEITSEFGELEKAIKQFVAKVTK